MTTTTDALIVGGGPAGLAAAIALRQKGIDCLVADAQRPPIEKGCGEGLMPETLGALAALGVTMAEDEGHGFRGIRFVDPSFSVDACFPHGTGIGLRRTHLHGRMHERALALGVRFAWGKHVNLSGEATVGGEAVRFGWLIGADGTASRVREWAGLAAATETSRRLGFRRHYRVAPWSEYVEVHWGEAGQMYITPVGVDQVCVVLITRHGRVAGEDFLRGFPEVAARLEGASAITPQRAAVSMGRRLRCVARGRVALLGDASGSVDAITGEGLAMSFRQAAALAGSLAKGGVEEYATAHRAIGRLPHMMARLMLMMDRWPVVQRLGMRALAANPVLFAELLGVHAGVGTLRGVALRRGAEVGRGLFAASLHG